MRKASEQSEQGEMGNSAFPLFPQLILAARQNGRYEVAQCQPTDSQGGEAFPVFPLE
jgi:hypothetical protein